MKVGELPRTLALPALLLPLPYLRGEVKGPHAASCLDCDGGETGGGQGQCGRPVRELVRPLAERNGVWVGRGRGSRGPGPGTGEEHASDHFQEQELKVLLPGCLDVAHQQEATASLRLALSASAPHAVTSQTSRQPPSMPSLFPPSPWVPLTQVDSAPRSACAHSHTALRGPVT